MLAGKARSGRPDWRFKNYELVKTFDRRCSLLGNLDAIHGLPVIGLQLELEEMAKCPYDLTISCACSKMAGSGVVLKVLPRKRRNTETLRH